MEALDVDRFAVVGHDRGARVAYRMALDHPDRLGRFGAVNVIPTLDQLERMGAGPSLGYRPRFLLAQPAPFPEVVSSQRKRFLRFVFTWTETPGAIDAEAFDVYLLAQGHDDRIRLRRLPRQLPSRPRARGR
jgi:haloacetate dehalogenase